MRPMSRSAHGATDAQVVFVVSEHVGAARELV